MKVARNILSMVLKGPRRKQTVKALIQSCDLGKRLRLPGHLGQHLQATLDWLLAAQNANSDGGVPAWYDLRTGWAPSYPETTGYIIPTLVACADFFHKPEVLKRAGRMAAWEIQVQRSDGAIRSGTTSQAPAVFNTGQVLFGWCAMYRGSPATDLANALAKACVWLVGQQGDDGAWRKNLSVETASLVQTYNTRTAWGLATAGVTMDEDTWKEAAKANCRWAVSQQNEVGWFSNNVFVPGEEPLLHTIGYVIEGLLGVGLLLDVPEFISASRRALDALVMRFNSHGGCFGRYDARWHPTVRWRCLTGESQIAVALMRYSQHVERRDDYVSVAKELILGVCLTQILDSQTHNLHGAVAGSSPLWGDYFPWRYPNWAAKFTLDALLLSEYGIDPDLISPAVETRARQVRALT